MEKIIKSDMIMIEGTDSTRNMPDFNFYRNK